MILCTKEIRQDPRRVDIIMLIYPKLHGGVSSKYDIMQAPTMQIAVCNARDARKSPRSILNPPVANFASSYRGIGELKMVDALLSRLHSPSLALNVSNKTQIAW